MERESWTNQYVSLIGTKPEIIIPLTTEEQIASAKEIIAQKSAQFDAVCCELGSGSGNHIVEHADRNQRTLFVGFEIRYKRLFRTAEKAEKRSLTNLLMMQGNASHLAKVFPPESLSGIYVNFPDPWAKRRWRKNRLLNQQFLEQVLLVLRSGGFFSYKTDHLEYFQETVSSVTQMSQFCIETVTNNLHAEKGFESLVMTEFEQLFRSQEQNVNYLLAKKIGK